MVAGTGLLVEALGLARVPGHALAAGLHAREREAVEGRTLVTALLERGRVGGGLGLRRQAKQAQGEKGGKRGFLHPRMVPSNGSAVASAFMSPRSAGLTALAMSAFAANSLLCRAALGRAGIDPFSFTSVRLWAGALTLALLVLARGGRLRLGGGYPALALAGYALFSLLAYTRIPAAVGALALFGAVQVTMIGRGLASGERPAAREWLGRAASGGLLLPGLASPDPLGLALMLAAGAAWGAYSLLGRGAPDPLAASAANFALAAPLVLATQLAALRAAPPHASALGLLLAVLSGALASGLGYAVWYAALRGLSATQAAVAQLSVPPLAALGAVSFLGESLSPRLLLSGAAILGGIALCLSPSGPSAGTPAPRPCPRLRGR